MVALKLAFSTKQYVGGFMEFEKDRGTILRITFDIVYPDGQLKTVAMNRTDWDKWADAGIIAFSKKAIEQHLHPSLKQSGKSPADLFDTFEDGADTKPAMLIIHDDGKITPKCGAHRSRRQPLDDDHTETEEAIGRFM